MPARGTDTTSPPSIGILNFGSVVSSKSCRLMTSVNGGRGGGVAAESPGPEVVVGEGDEPFESADPVGAGAGGEPAGAANGPGSGAALEMITVLPASLAIPPASESTSRSVTGRTA